MKFVPTLSMIVIFGLTGAAQVKAQVFYPNDDGFESPDLGTSLNAFGYAPPGTAWTFLNFSGIAANGSGFGVTGATQGEASDSAVSSLGQAAVIQDGGNQGSISQSITLPAGYASVSFEYEGRDGYGANEIGVSLGGFRIFDDTPTTFTSFTPETTSSTGYLAGGTYNLVFSGLDPSINDVTTFIDNVSINVTGVPEPSNWGWMAFAGAVVAFASRQFHSRKSNAA